jgi:hypothetical protein
MPLPGEFEITVDPGDDGVPGTEDDVYFPEFFRDLSFVAFEAYAIDLDPDAVDAGDPVPFFPAVMAGTVFQEGSILETGNAWEASFGGAVEAAPGLMAGLSLNIPYGSWNFEKTLAEDDVFNDNDGTNGTVDFDYLTWTETIRTRMTGFNVKAGLSYEVSPQIRIGGSFETPTWYSLNERFNTFIETGFDDGFSARYGLAADQTVGSGVFDYKITTPWRFGLGLVYTGSPVRVFGDVEFVDWSSMSLDSHSFEFSQANADIRRVMRSVVNVRVGAEYAMDRFVVRGGYAYQPDGRDVSQTGFEGTAERNRTTWSAGVSYLQRPYAIDFAWALEQYEDVFRPYTEVEAAPVVTEEIFRNRFAIGVRLFF